MAQGGLTDAAFAARLDALGPFESHPRLAVAVSGGPDSLCLALLADAWARARGGSVLALTVDHRLRPESADEAAQVGRWLAARGVAHRVLVRDGARPSADLQAEARKARYALLRSACAEAGIVHLLLGHQLEDQAETLLDRLCRGSGVDGLAAMAPITELDEVRLLRPLLDVPREALVVRLRAEGQGWIDDPSNQNPQFTRVRLRRLLPALAEEGADAGRLAATARSMARSRSALDNATAALAARAIALDTALGCARLAPEALADADEELAIRLLSRLLACVGGLDHPPRLESLERLFQAVAHGLDATRSLAGCLIVPKRDHLLVCREPAAVAPPVDLRPGEEALWDGRYRIRARTALRVGALAEGRLDVPQASEIPALVAATLPAFYDQTSICAVPGLGYNRRGQVEPLVEFCRFAPRRPLTPIGFFPSGRAGSPCENGGPAYL